MVGSGVVSCRLEAAASIEGSWPSNERLAFALASHGSDNAASVSQQRRACARVRVLAPVVTGREARCLARVAIVQYVSSYARLQSRTHMCVCVFRVPTREGNTYTHMMLMLMVLMVAVVLVYNVEAGCATAHGGSTSESDAHHGSRSISKQRPSAGDS